ncbi:uncharacterized protein LOC134685567 [Mytilus trossulus]|uniref:uncharacterized protein LOC134685567 n=1 Tax=Mytilus trossulus TaxID=6551 RepID=UPI0030064386
MNSRHSLYKQNSHDEQHNLEQQDIEEFGKSIENHTSGSEQDATDKESSMLLIPQAHKKESRWKEHVYELSQCTTLHGVRYLGMKDTSIISKVLWVCVIGLCGGIMAYNMSDRLMYYLQSPVNVNVKVHHNTSLIFPSVTICNQNAFRLTAANEHNWYDFIETLYNSNRTSTGIDWKKYNATDLTFSELYLKTGHTKEDMIHSCRFAGKKCGAKDFKTILTDQGLCFTFKPDKNSKLRVHRELRSWHTGSDNGLKLVLNTEQYEHMDGPNIASGIKLLAHHDTDIPRVKELGISVPTHSYAMIGVDLTVIESLQKPYGNCKDKPLNYSREYTKDDCLFECLSRVAERKCGCSNYLIPKDKTIKPKNDDEEDDEEEEEDDEEEDEEEDDEEDIDIKDPEFVPAESPVHASSGKHVQNKIEPCSIKKYLHCYQKKYDLAYLDYNLHCNCPAPCSARLYKPLMSYASTVEKDDDRNKQTSIQSSGAEIHGNLTLQAKVQKAVEIKHRKNVVRRKVFNRIRTNFMQEYKNYKMMIGHDMLMYKWKTKFSKMLDYDRKCIEKMKELFLFQIYNLEYNFILARQEMEEETISNVCQGYNEIRSIVENTLMSLSVKNRESQSNILFYTTQLFLQSKLENLDNAADNISTLFNSYSSGKPIFHYSFKNYSESYNMFIVPKKLLRDSMRHYIEYSQKYSSAVDGNIESVRVSMNEYLSLLKSVMESGNLNEQRMSELSKNYKDNCKAFLYNKRVFYKECLDRPLEILKTNLKNFTSLTDKYLKSMEFVLKKYNQFKTKLVEKPDLTEFLLLLQDYLVKPNITKDDLYIKSRLTKLSIARIVSDFDGLKRIQNTVYDKLSENKEPIAEIWRVINYDENMKTFYDSVNKSIFSKSHLTYFKNGHRYGGSGNIFNLAQWWWRPSDVVYGISNLEKRFDELYEDLNLFKKQTRIDDNFNKTNFLPIDIFFRELSFMEIKQQEAYDLWAFFCDVGGALGLFVGASAVTLFEFMDCLVHIVLSLRKK